jgi:hypothetical protein
MQKIMPFVLLALFVGGFVASWINELLLPVARVLGGM